MSTSYSVVRITRGGAEPEVVEAKTNGGFSDSGRWSEDSQTLPVGIHTVPIEEFIGQSMRATQTGNSMFKAFNITRLDPNTMENEIVMPSGIYGAFGAATGAIDVDGRIWLSSCASDRITIFDLEPCLRA